VKVTDKKYLSEEYCTHCKRFSEQSGRERERECEVRVSWSKNMLRGKFQANVWNLFVVD
jgi:hypothetical protein